MEVVEYEEESVMFVDLLHPQQQDAPVCVRINGSPDAPPAMGTVLHQDTTPYELDAAAVEREIAEFMRVHGDQIETVLTKDYSKESIMSSACDVEEDLDHWAKMSLGELNRMLPTECNIDEVTIQDTQGSDSDDDAAMYRKANKRARRNPTVASRKSSRLRKPNPRYLSDKFSISTLHGRMTIRKNDITKVSNNTNRVTKNRKQVPLFTMPKVTTVEDDEDMSRYGDIPPESSIHLEDGSRYKYIIVNGYIVYRAAYVPTSVTGEFLGVLYLKALCSTAADQARDKAVPLKEVLLHHSSQIKRVYVYGGACSSDYATVAGNRLEDQRITSARILAAMMSAKAKWVREGNVAVNVVVKEMCHLELARREKMRQSEDRVTLGVDGVQNNQSPLHGISSIRCSYVLVSPDMRRIMDEIARDTNEHAVMDADAVTFDTFLKEVTEYRGHHMDMRVLNCMAVKHFNDERVRYEDEVYNPGKLKANGLKALKAVKCREVDGLRQVAAECSMEAMLQRTVMNNTKIRNMNLAAPTTVLSDYTRGHDKVVHFSSMEVYSLLQALRGSKKQFVEVEFDCCIMLEDRTLAIGMYDERRIHTDKFMLTRCALSGATIRMVADSLRQGNGTVLVLHDIHLAYIVGLDKVIGNNCSKPAPPTIIKWSRCTATSNPLILFGYENALSEMMPQNHVYRATRYALEVMMYPFLIACSFNIGFMSKSVLNGSIPLKHPDIRKLMILTPVGSSVPLTLGSKKPGHPAHHMDVVGEISTVCETQVYDATKDEIRVTFGHYMNERKVEHLDSVGGALCFHFLVSLTGPFRAFSSHGITTHQVEIYNPHLWIEEPTRDATKSLLCAMISGGPHVIEVRSNRPHMVKSGMLTTVCEAIAKESYSLNFSCEKIVFDLTEGDSNNDRVRSIVTTMLCDKFNKRNTSLKAVDCLVDGKPVLINCHDSLASIVNANEHIIAIDGSCILPRAQVFAEACLFASGNCSEGFPHAVEAAAQFSGGSLSTKRLVGVLAASNSSALWRDTIMGFTRAFSDPTASCFTTLYCMGLVEETTEADLLNALYYLGCGKTVYVTTQEGVWKHVSLSEDNTMQTARVAVAHLAHIMRAMHIANATSRHVCK